MIHLNSGNLDVKSQRNTDVEFGDLYFTNCMMLQGTTILAFSNDKRQPVSHKEDGTPLYPIDSNGEVFIDVSKIESIENVAKYEDWFMLPTSRVINLYVFPENSNVDGHRNVITIGFMS